MEDNYKTNAEPLLNPDGSGEAICVEARINNELIDIGYACDVDWETKKVTVPENMPGGVEVLVNGHVIFTTPIELEDRSQHVKKQFMESKRAKGFVPSQLSVCVRAGLMMEHGYESPNVSHPMIPAHLHSDWMGGKEFAEAVEVRCFYAARGVALA